VFIYTYSLRPTIYFMIQSFRAPYTSLDYNPLLKISTLCLHIPPPTKQVSGSDLDTSLLITCLSTLPQLTVYENIIIFLRNLNNSVSVIA
jgi:hypothetical protein